MHPLLRLVADDIAVDPAHQLVAPTLIRLQASSLLLDAVHKDELTEREELRRHKRLTETKAEGIVPPAEPDALVS